MLVPIANDKRYVNVLAITAVLAIITIGGFSALALVNGTATLTVTSTVTITMPVSSAYFGEMALGATNNTLNGKPPPFQVQNDGNVKVNITINASDLWGLTANPTANYRYLGNVSTEGYCWANQTSGAITTWTNMPAVASPTKFMPLLNFTDTCDLAEVEMEVTVPNPESTGAKSSIVTLIASETT